MLETVSILTILFFIVALFYSLVGFGGGSSYVALLFLFGISYETSPMLALLCNLIVVTGGLIYFYRSGELKFNFIFPFVLTSVPMAYIGGLIPVSRFIFLLFLGLSLFFSSLKMLFFSTGENRFDTHIDTPPISYSSILGGVLGLLSGVVGIGGGIFLAPLCYFFKWGKPRRIAATACCFIFLNSISGLLGQMQKNNGEFPFNDYWPLLLAVFFGGQLGSFFCSFKFSPRKIEALTGVLVLIVSLRILYNSTILM
jgi:uncharacterized membrane protein YfcA